MRSSPVAEAEVARRGSHGGAAASDMKRLTTS
jgi:hypothetical protein